MQMYGDRYADAADADTEDMAPPFAVPEELMEQWQKQTV